MNIDDINAELSMIAADAKEAEINALYEEMLMDQLAHMAACYTMADDDCDGPWYWELK